MALHRIDTLKRYARFLRDNKKKSNRFLMICSST